MTDRDNIFVNTDKIHNDSEADKFLRNLGIRVSRDIVSRLMNILTGKNDDSSYDLYAGGRRRDGSVRLPVCGKGTVFKITNLYKAGKLDPYLTYLDSKSQAVVSRDYGNLDSIKQETLTKAEQTTPTEEIPEIKQPVMDQFSQEKIGKEHIDIVDSQGKYPEEWRHYDKIKEAIIQLQHASGKQIEVLIDVIERERVTLNDSDLRKDLGEYIEAVKENVSLGMNLSGLSITPIISRTSKRMNKRYKKRK